MKREPTDEEKARITKALEQEEKRVKELKEGLWYIEETIKNQEMIWQYEDNTREYKRRVEKERFIDAKQKMLPEIEWSENSIKVFKDQLINGIEIKENK